MGIRRLAEKILFVTLFLALSMFTSSLVALAALSEGDLAIVGVNFDTNEVAVVALTDISAGETVFITDRGWDDATNTFTTGASSLDGTFTWTTPTMSAGDIITFQISAASTISATITGGGSTGTHTTTEWTLLTLPAAHGFSDTGESIIIYQGSAPNPNFIFAFNGIDGAGPCAGNTAVAANMWCGSVDTLNLFGSTEPESGGTPIGSTAQVNLSGSSAVGEHQDNNVYNGPTSTADQATWLTRISDESNWNQDNSTPFSLDPTDAGNDLGGSGGFDVTVPPSDPTIDKAFSPSTIAIDGTSTLTFTLTNTDATSALTNLAFTDTLPAGVEIAATPNIGGTCNSNNVLATHFTPNLAAGGTAINLVSGSGYGLAASASCTITVDVTATTAGSKNNTTGALTSAETPSSTDTASDTLTVLADPTFEKAFSPDTIAVGGTSTLTFTITNTNTSSGLTGLNFTDSLPAGVEIDNPTNLGGTCGSTTFSPAIAAGGTAINLTAGTIGANTTCTIIVNVTATSSGAKNNTAMDIGSTETGAGTDDASDTLTVLDHPTIDKAFSPSTIALGGTSTLTFTITNTNSSGLTGLNFTDTYPAGVVNATPLTVGGTCGSITHTATAGGGTFNLTSATIGASTTCTVTVLVTATTAGSLVNTTGNVGSTETGAGVDNATDTLIVEAPDLSITKSNDAPGGQAESGTAFNWILTVTNNGTADADFGIGTVVAGDNLPADATYGTIATNPVSGITGMITCGIITNVLSCTAIGGTFTIAPGGSFTVAIEVTPNISTGTLTNPDGGNCQVDPDDEVTESNEANNDCNSDSVIVTPPFDITAPQTIRVSSSFNIPTWCGTNKEEFSMNSNDFVNLEQIDTEIEIVLPQKRILGLIPFGNNTASILEMFTLTEPSNFQSPGSMTLPVKTELKQGKTIRITCDNLIGLPTRLDGGGEIDQFLSQILSGVEFFHGVLTISSDNNDLKVYANKIVRRWSGVNEGGGIQFTKGKQTRERIEIERIRVSDEITTMIEVNNPMNPLNVAASDDQHELKDTKLSVQALRAAGGSRIEFRTQNMNTTHMQVEIYGLNGTLVHNSGETRGNRLSWNLLDMQSRPVANGVYLYVVTIRGGNGVTLVHSEVKKLLVLR